MADAARRLRRRCASFDRRQHAGAPRGYAMEHVGGQRCSCHACQQNLCSWARRAVQRAKPFDQLFGCPDVTLRAGNANTLRFSRFNEHSLCARFIGNPLCPRAADHMSRNDRRITSRAAAACKTRLHAAPAAVRRAKAPRASGPRGIDWTGRENQWQWMTVPRTAASAVRNSLRARPRYVRFGQHVRYRLSDLSLRKEPNSPVISASRHELR